MAPGEGGVRWNPRSQRWERVERVEQGPAQAAPDAPATAPDAPPPTPPPAASPYSYPPGVPPLPEGPSAPPPARRRRTLVVVALGVAVLGAAVAGWLYLGHKGPGPDSGPARSDYTQVRDTAAGFSVAIPPGWQASPGETAYGTVYRPAGGDRSAGLQVFRAAEDTKAACEVLRESTAELSKSSGYREISNEPVAGDGCEQVYEYDDPGSSDPAAHAIVRLVVAAGDTRWVLMVYGPRTDVPLVRRHLEAAVESFRAD
ncbi:hypothetical protein [Streptomyces sp. NBC_01546]|uniref:hypothetical protein n=1 Tax=Streptomyces sp. NBC_01546 TaxID=2975872 RepID=UPI003869C40E